MFGCAWPSSSLLEFDAVVRCRGRSMIEGMSRRTRMHPSEDSFSSSDQDSSFRKRQAGMLDAKGEGLSGLRLAGTLKTESTSSISAEDIKVGGEVLGVGCSWFRAEGVGIGGHVMSGVSLWKSAVDVTPRCRRGGVMIRCAIWGQERNRVERVERSLRIGPCWTRLTLEACWAWISRPASWQYTLSDAVRALIV